MNSNKDAANASTPRQPAGPVVVPGGELRDPGKIATLLESIAREIAEGDQLQSHALADLRARLNLMADRSHIAEVVPAAATALPPSDPGLAPVLPRTQARMAAQSLEHIYASVAAAYTDAAQSPARKAQWLPSAPRSPAPAAGPGARPEPVAEAEAEADDFLDLSALVEPMVLRPSAPKNNAPKPPQRAPDSAPASQAAPSRPSMEPSLAIHGAIGDLARRIADTERRIDQAMARPDDAKAVAALTSQIEALRGDFDKLLTDHRAASMEVGKVSVSLGALSLAAARIGPIGDGIENLAAAIATLRQDLPAISQSTAELTTNRIAAALAKTSAHAELTDKIAIVQNLLLTQARDQHETDGRSFGALQSIRGLVENLHSRIDALETDEASEAVPAMTGQGVASQLDAIWTGRPLPLAVAPPPGLATRPEPADAPIEAAAPAAMPPPPAAPAAMSREEMIASAQRAAKASAYEPQLAQEPRQRTASAALRGAAAGKSAPGRIEGLGSRSIVTLAMVALLAAGLGMVYAKVMRKHAPAITIEQTALPDMPEDAMAAGSGKDAAKPLPSPSSSPATPTAGTPDKGGKSSALLPRDLGAPAVAGQGLVQAASFSISAADAMAPSADILPAAIAPLSLRTAALSGDAAAAYAIAGRYLAGQGVAADAAKAEHWYELAARTGLAAAEFKLGALFERGDVGLAANRASALTWYRKGAGHGNVQAMHNLAVLDTAPLGGERNYAEAAKWFEVAANHGLKDSQYNLAVLYENGLGVPKAIGTAYKWMTLAAAHGDGDAAKRRDALRKRLPAESLASIEAVIKAWHQKS